MTPGELAARTKPMTPAEATAARDRLEALANALLQASITVLTGDERAALGWGTGLDATPVPLFSRGPSKRAGLCASGPVLRGAENADEGGVGGADVGVW